MWNLALVKGGTEFSVRDSLVASGAEVFLPYTREKMVVLAKSAPTYACPRPRAVYKSVWAEIPRWPRYLFAKGEDLKGVALVRSADNEPALLPQHFIDTLRKECAPDGRVLRTSSLHSFSVGDLLRFVGRIGFEEKLAEVLSIEETGNLNVLVDGHVKVRVDYKELART